MNEHWKPSPSGAPIGFWIDVEPHRDTVKLIPAGELDIATVKQLDSELDALIEAGFGRIVIDLRRVEFIDSAAVHSLFSARERAAREQWQLAIVPGRPAVQRLFEITNTLEQLPFTPAMTNSSSPASRLPRLPDGVEVVLRRWGRPLADPALPTYPRAR